MFGRLCWTALAGVTLGALATAAAADEVWTTEFGEIVYLYDIEGSVDGSAVLSFTHFDGTVSELIVPGLAGNFDARAVHEGYWIGRGEPVCETMMTLPGGTPSGEWGSALVAFDAAGFPTSFTLMIGWCDGPYITSIRALPKVG